MKTLKLDSEYREPSGKGTVRKLRAEGMIPGVLYGQGEDTVSIALNELEFRKILSANWETAIVSLAVTGTVNKEVDAIIKDVQHHPASGRVLHVDFQHIRRGEKLRIEVPVSLTGAPIGVKEQGGILEHGSRELAIRCLPRHIPEGIEIDVTALGIQDGIHIRDIVERYPDLEFLDDPDVTLAIVVPPKIEVEAEVEAEVEEGEEPEVIAKGKEEGEEGEQKPAS